ncbi:MAG TPA: amino acid racemase [bacterium]|nr:amino acid racemase [bacterium]
MSGGKTGRRTIGVIGGMGPLATADFYLRLVRATPAATDQEHLHVLIDSNPEIPDRTEAIEGRGPDPTPLLVETARRLVAAGAEVLVMPCNSAHAFLDRIRGAVAVPVLDIMEEVASTAASLRPAPAAAGLLATAGTVRQRLYHAALSRRGIEVVAPDAGGQRVVSEIIAAVKAGDTGPAVRGRIRDAAAALVRAGAVVIVIGCTELPLILGSEDLAAPVLDGTEILARAAIREGFGEYHSSRERSQGSIRASPRPVRRH